MDIRRILQANDESILENNQTYPAMIEKLKRLVESMILPQSAVWRYFTGGSIRTLPDSRI